MTAKRHYQLLCPIARALDVLGDRWALLILRDLHAGPARFNELESGLGIATNLLSTRLAELSDSGLIEKSPGDGRGAYRLTRLGRETDRVLWELARFGGRIDPESDPKEPGNLRTIALPLRIMLESVPDRPDLVARLVVDNDSFTITSNADGVDVAYGETETEPHVVIQTDYQGFLKAGEGRISLEEFSANHLRIVDGEEQAGTLLALLAAAMSAIE